MKSSYFLNDPIIRIDGEVTLKHRALLRNRTKETHKNLEEHDLIKSHSHYNIYSYGANLYYMKETT